MKSNLPLADDKKLTVVFRLETGCLGPAGETHIEAFCQLALNKFSSMHSDFLHWGIVPRYDKSLPEMQYVFNYKNLSQEQATKFFALFDVSLDEFEDTLHKKLTVLIEQYLGH